MHKPLPGRDDFDTACGPFTTPPSLRPVRMGEELPFRFAYASNAFRFYPLPRVLDLVASAGFDGIELMADVPHLYPPDWRDDAKLAALKRTLDATGLTVTNLNGYTLFALGDNDSPCWIQDDVEARSVRLAYTREVIELAARLGAPSLTVMPGGKLERPDVPQSREQCLERFLSGFRELVPLAGELGVTLLVEPEPECLIETVRDFADFLERLTPEERSVVRMNCDVGHLVCAGDDPASVILEWRDWIQHVHLEDIVGRVHDHKILGHGEINLRAVLDALCRVQYRGWVTIELYPYQDNPVEAGQKSLAYLAQLLGSHSSHEARTHLRTVG